MHYKRRKEGRKEEDLILLRFCGGWESFQKSAAGNEADGIFAVAVSSFLCVLLLPSIQRRRERGERDCLSPAAAGCVYMAVDMVRQWRVMQSGVNRVGHQKIDGRDKSSNAGKSGESTQHTLHAFQSAVSQPVAETEHGTDALMDQRRKSSTKQLLDRSRYIHTHTHTAQSQSGSSYRVRVERRWSPADPSRSLPIPFFFIIIIPPLLLTSSPTSLIPPSGCCLLEMIFKLMIW